MPLESKLPHLGTNIFSVMSGLAHQQGAINLSQGFPDFDCDEELKRLVYKYMQEGKNQYAPMPGVPELRQRLATKINSLYETKTDPELNITVTAGATQAIFTALGAVVKPGDEVILFDPSYDCYAPGIQIFGGKPVALPLKGPDFRIDWDKVETLVTDKTVAIMINSPHNPLGVLLTPDDMENLSRIVEQHDLYVISDEVYEHIVFDDLKHISVLDYPELFKRSFATFSFGKVFHVTGWKVGYCVAPEDLTREFRKIHQFNVFCVNAPVQYALSEFLEDASRYMGLSPFFQQKRDFFLREMQGSGFRFLESKGSYFILADYSAVSDLNDMDFAQWLTREFGVATIPLTPFYANPPGNQKVVRFCFAKTEEVLEEAAHKLKKVPVKVAG